MIKVGIPRALGYYQYYPMWRAFFETLGAEVVVSPPSTRAILAEGTSRVVTDTCLPAKMFLGHVVELKDKCDFMFVPVIRSMKKRVYNCSKFLGLPDMTRAVIPDCPPVLDIDIDVNKNKRVQYQAIYNLGRRIAWNPFNVRRAGHTAWETHKRYVALMTRESLPPPQAIARFYGQKEAAETGEKPYTIALVGHPYLLYDEHINHRLIHRLEAANCRILTPEMISEPTLEAATGKIVGRALWTYEEEVVGSGGYYFNQGVDGIIGVVAFGCGPDSLIMDMVRREAEHFRNTAFMLLTLEEHTAETGVITRLEAFLDMIQRRKRKGAA